METQIQDNNSVVISYKECCISNRDELLWAAALDFNIIICRDILETILLGAGRYTYDAHEAELI